MKDNNKKLMYVFTILFLLVLIFISVASVITPDAKRSIKENRFLLQYTPPTKDTIFSGEWFSSIESYCKEQVIHRDDLLTCYYNFLDHISLKERLGYVHGKDDYILPVNEYVDDSQSNTDTYGLSQANALEILQAAADTYGGKVIYLDVPSKNVLYSETYPAFYNRNEEHEALFREKTMENVQKKGITAIETYDLLKAHKDEYIYYATDHHYTVLGAYYVYRELLSTINDMDFQSLSFPEWNDLEQDENPERLVGSYLQKLGDGGSIDCDHMTFAIPKDMPSYTRYDNGEECDTPLYDKSVNDYATFMGGNIANTVVDTNRTSLPDICYIGYSFTNILEMYSVYNFNKVESIDPRYYEGVMTEYILENKPDYIVVIRNDVYENNPSNKSKVR